MEIIKYVLRYYLANMSFSSHFYHPQKKLRRSFPVFLYKMGKIVMTNIVGKRCC